MKRPEIVATVGPASLDRVAALCDAGADILRINASHVGPGELAGLLARVRAAAPGAPLVVDLQGAKMRLGPIAAREVRAGERVRFALAPRDAGDVHVPHEELFGAVVAGDTLGVDDDRLHFTVVRVGPGIVETDSVTAGTLRPRKGINVVEHPVELIALTEADRAHVAAADAHDGVSLAFSFMVDGHEAAWLDGGARRHPVIGKIERREAIDNAARIADAVDAIWICRGDLGAQLGPLELARRIAAFDPRVFGVPVLMAGQVLEHLTAHAAPTRSEVCHLHDLVARGYAGIVLSDETAIGIDPVNAVRTVRALVDGFAA